MGDTIKKAADFALKSKKLAEATKLIGGISEAGKIAMTSPSLDVKTKELLAVALGINSRCEACIMHHVRLAIEAGCSREEIVGVIEICILMGGGPSMSYGAIALDVYDDLIQAQ